MVTDAIRLALCGRRVLVFMKTHMEAANLFRWVADVPIGQADALRLEAKIGDGLIRFVSINSRPPLGSRESFDDILVDHAAGRDVPAPWAVTLSVTNHP